MTGTQSAYTAITTIFTLAALCWLLFWLYPDYRTDLFRQRMFALRHSLFDEALAGRIDFKNPAYGELRRIMNGFILKAERMSLLQVVLFLILTRRLPRTDDPNSFEKRWERVTRGLKPQERTLLDDYLKRVHILVVKHALWSSPLLFLSMATVIPLVVCWFVGRFWMNNLLHLLAKQLSRMDAAASAIGGSKVAAAT